MICVIMGAESRDERNAAATKLLDWGFATYGLFTAPGGSLSPLRVTGGTAEEVGLSYPAFTAVLPKSERSAVDYTVTLPESLPAPIQANEAVGKITYTCKGENLGEVSISATETVERLEFWGLWIRLLRGVFGM